MVISFLGVRTDGRIDRVLESSHGNMSAHKKFSTQSSKLGVHCGSLYASPDDGDAQLVTVIGDLM